MPARHRIRKPATCERCGRLYSSSSTCRSHEKTCRLIPIPEQLLCEFLADSSLSVEYLSVIHGVSREFIRSHLSLAGLSNEEIMERWDNRRSVKRDAQTCDECKIYIFSDKKSLPRKWQWHVNGAVATPDGRQLCPGCARESGYEVCI